MAAIVTVRTCANNTLWQEVICTNELHFCSLFLMAFHMRTDGRYSLQQEQQSQRSVTATAEAASHSSHACHRVAEWSVVVNDIVNTY
jgi:hypothetical protein